MEIFNKDLLKGLEKEERGLASLILFTTKENLNIYHFLKVENGQVILSDNLHEDVNRIIRKLMDNGVLHADYEGLVRVSPMMPLYVNKKEKIEELDVEVIRNYFKNSYLSETYGIDLSGKAGDPKACKKFLKYLTEEYDDVFENVDNNILAKATHKYIDSCVAQERYLLDCDNFIWKDDKSKLVEFIEEVLDEGTKTDQIKSGKAQDWTTQ